MPKKKAFFYFLACAALIAGSSLPAAALTIKPGASLPAATLFDHQGHPVDLNKSVMGQVTVLVYWSVTCHACVEDVPVILREYRNQKHPDYRLLLVAGDAPEMVAVAKCFVLSKGLGKAVSLIDQVTKPSALAEKLQVEYTPTVLVLDKKGKLFKAFEGTPRLKELKEAIGGALKAAK